MGLPHGPSAAEQAVQTVKKAISIALKLGKNVKYRTYKSLCYL